MIRDYYGPYRNYRSSSGSGPPPPGVRRMKQEAVGGRQLAGVRKQQETKKLSFNEKREYEQLEKEIGQLEAEKAGIEAALAAGELGYEELTGKSTRIAEVMELLDEKMLRWMELDERA